MPKTSALNYGINASELALWGRLFEPIPATLAPDVARFLLTLHFPQNDLNRMNHLAERARSGELSLDEQIELDNYERVGNVLSLLKSKARQTLKPARTAKRA